MKAEILHIQLVVQCHVVCEVVQVIHSMVLFRGALLGVCFPVTQVDAVCNVAMCHPSKWHYYCYTCVNH